MTEHETVPDANPASLPSVADRAARTAPWLRELAGPALIIAVGLIAMHAYAFDGLMTITKGDPLAFFLPTRCYGSSVVGAGSIPGWNPHVFAGTPFAADPQSGWLYLEHMLVFSALPCGAAIRWLIVLNPLVAGLGLYGFLRSERVSRTAATLGGVALAMSFASMVQVTSLPGEGALGWTVVLLLTASRFVQARSWARRLAWAPVVALAWGEVASAHLTHGLAVGTLALGGYLAFRLIHDVCARAIRARTALVGCAVLLAAIVSVNVAILLPRAELLQRTSVTSYGAIDATGGGSKYGHTPPTSPRWPFKLAEDQGAYLGAMVLCLALAAPWSRRLRYLMGALATFAAICYVVAAQLLPDALARHLPLSDLLYFHAGHRFAYGVVLALAGLAAIGLDAWLEERRTDRRIWMLVPGVVVWLAVGPWMGAPLSNLRWLFVGGVVGAVVLVVVRRLPALALLVPAAVAVELLANALIWQTAPEADILFPPQFGLGELPYEITAARAPTAFVDEYLQRGRFAKKIASGDGRYLTSGSPGQGGYKAIQPEDWPALGAQRSMLFDLEEPEGYNPVQLRRFWDYARGVARRSNGHLGSYRASVFNDPPEQVLDLLNVNWLISKYGWPPSTPGWSRAGREGYSWILYRRDHPTDRVSLLYDWSVVDGEQAALAGVLDHAFDPEREAILEQDPGIPMAEAPTTPGIATYTEEGTQGARVDVTTPQPAVLLVRNSFDSPWRATVDGADSPVLVADSMLQAVVVPAGQHTVLLRYDDPTIALGLAVSIVALVTFEGIALVLEVRDRRRARRRSRSAAQPNAAEVAEPSQAQ